MIGKDDTSLTREELAYIADNEYAASWIARRLLEARSSDRLERPSEAAKAK